MGRNYKIEHTILYDHREIEIEIEWEYFPELKGTWYDPTESRSVVLKSFQILGGQIYEGEEVDDYVKWYIDEYQEELEAEALEEISSQLERLKNGGHEYD